MDSKRLTRLSNYIMLSTILSEKQKKDLISRFPTFDDKQIKIIESVFIQGKQLTDDILTNALKANPKLAESYSNKVSQLSRNTYSKAEAFNRESETGNLLNGLDD